MPVVMRKLIVVALSSLFVVVGCGGGSSPISPTPTTTPVATTPTPTAPTAPTPTLTFTPQTAAPVGAALALFPGSRGQEAGKISLAVTAHNLNGIVTVYGTLRFDPTVIVYDNWGEGDWFKQGPEAPTIDWSFGTTPGQIRLALSRTSAGLAGASGSGEIILFRFRPAPNVTSGSTTIRWDGPSVRGQDKLRELPLNNAYGGTVTIQ